MQSKKLKADSLFRIYYYDSMPFFDIVVNPLDGKTIDFSTTPTARNTKALFEELEITSNIAFRKGDLRFRGWRITKWKTKQILEKAKNGKPIEAFDMEPYFVQKEVDIKIGLDLAWLSSKHIVDKIVLVTTDTDFIPAMKFARKEGVIVCVAPLGQDIKRSLLAHSDDIIN